MASKFWRTRIYHVVKHCGALFTDRTYLSILYWSHFGRRLPLEAPQTMNEKLQWLKLYNHNPLYTTLVDKVEVKKYVAERIGQQYVIPTLRVWQRAEDIDLEGLPERFVIKANHSGGNRGIVICQDRKSLDVKAVREKMQRAMKYDIYRRFREWPYKAVEKRILAEEMIGTPGEELSDYKFYCFGGKVDSVLLCSERHTGSPKFYFFDREWQLRRYNKRGKEAPEGFTLPKPEGLDEMFALAERLSEGMPFVRVDLYNVGGRIYFGEMTFFPASGFDVNRLPETDLHFGSLIELPEPMV